MATYQLPKIFSWEKQLNQTHWAVRPILLTSGCSFTASTIWFEGPASWPGFVKDRAGFETVVDYSYPGVGNRYINDSILHGLETHDDKDIAVVIMWSGINRYEMLEQSEPNTQPVLGDKLYIRRTDLEDQKQIIQNQIHKSFTYISELATLLKAKNIPYLFTSYINLVYEPFLPCRDTTPFWPKHQRKDIANLLNPKKHNEFLYDYSFFNNYLDDGDSFHPPVEANLAWTDNVLLPYMTNTGMIQKI